MLTAARLLCVCFSGVGAGRAVQISLRRHPEWHGLFSFQERPALTYEFGMDKARASKCHNWLIVN